MTATGAQREATIRSNRRSFERKRLVAMVQALEGLSSQPDVRAIVCRVRDEVAHVVRDHGEHRNELRLLADAAGMIEAAAREVREFCEG